MDEEDEIDATAEALVATYHWDTVEDAARREVLEECGLTIGSMTLLGIFSGQQLNHIYPDGNEVCGIDIVYVSCDYTGSLGCNDGEVKSMGFFPLDALPQPISAMNAKQIGAYIASVHGAKCENTK